MGVMRLTGRPRDRRAAARGERNRTAICEILDAHSPRLPWLTLEQIKERLDKRGIHLKLTTISYHRNLIWEAEAIKDCRSNYSNPDTEPA